MTDRLPTIIARMNLNRPPKPLREFYADSLAVAVYGTRRELGEAAGDSVADHLRHLLDRQPEVRIVVGSAPSQDEFFECLTSPANLDTVDWSRVVVFHMDEYVGLPADHPQNFRAYQRDHLLAKTDVKEFHQIHGEVSDIDAECERLTALLIEKPIDLVCLGIGENGHLAFNDPPGDFSDSRWVKVVELDATCRQQQVNDGCFSSLDDVPTKAITLTLRVFQAASKLSGVVPASSKAAAVLATIEGPVSPACPATLMRHHPDARLFLDMESAALLHA
jgi:glucosamine-6-phosphate deaminase